MNTRIEYSQGKRISAKEVELPPPDSKIREVVVRMTDADFRRLQLLTAEAGGHMRVSSRSKVSRWAGVRGKRWAIQYEMRIVDRPVGKR